MPKLRVNNKTIILQIYLQWYLNKYKASF
uniref:Uncharacterized protein n=1 Tax=Lepeophtheirus salmonis TaxID=72036 RepID=A0A0K2UCD7_LEPSM